MEIGQRNPSTICQNSSQVFHMMSISAWCHLVSSSTPRLQRTIIRTLAPASPPATRQTPLTTTTPRRIEAAATARRLTARKLHPHQSATPSQQPQTLTSRHLRKAPPSQQKSTLMVIPVAFSHPVGHIISVTPTREGSFPSLTRHQPQSRICPHYHFSLEPAWLTQRLTV